MLHTLRRGPDLLGYVAIDSTVAGRARGGLRLLPDVAAPELEQAARAMTLKYGFLGLPQGGAKAGVLADPEDELAVRRARLHDFGLAAEDLLRERRYLPDSDMGTSAGDIRWMLESLAIPVGTRDWRHERSGEYTATSCLAAARAVLAHRGANLAGSSVAIEGFGRVGSALARQMHAAGATLVAVSTSRGALYQRAGLDVPRLLALAAEVGSSLVERYPDAERLPRQELLELPVTLLCPCARRHSIHAGNVARVAARFVCSGANDPIAPEAEAALWKRGVSYPPDFISNCGGVLGGTLDFAGVARQRAQALIERVVEPAVTRLLADAERLATMPRTIAEPLALARHARVRAAAEQPGLAGRAVSLGLEWYRRGLLPSALVGALAAGYIERRLRA